MRVRLSNTEQSPQGFSIYTSKCQISDSVTVSGLALDSGRLKTNIAHICRLEWKVLSALAVPCVETKRHLNTALPEATNGFIYWRPQNSLLQG